MRVGSGGCRIIERIELDSSSIWYRQKQQQQQQQRQQQQPDTYAYNTSYLAPLRPMWHQTSNVSFSAYRRRRCVYVSHPPGAVFYARLLDNQEGANANTARHVRLRKAPGEMFRAPCLFGTATIPAVEISTMEGRPRGLLYIPYYTGRLTFARGKLDYKTLLAAQRVRQITMASTTTSTR